MDEIDFHLGTIIGITLISLWLLSIIAFFNLDITNISPLYIIFAVWLRTFLHTGLFITIHETIHGVGAKNVKINALLGYIASFLYALLPYKTLVKNHHLHHSNPATEKDPDFYSANSNNFIRWYLSFMQEYQKGGQGWILFWGMTVIFWGLYFLHISMINMLLFWVIPILISSFQLFTFGIYLPHRQQDIKKSNYHRAISNNSGTFLSFITCFHFGYHWEHHQYPHLPWYKLPKARQEHLAQKRDRL